MTSLNMHDFLQQLVNGLSVGAVYALIALGYTMVYGVLRLINFAHGDVYMVGAVIAYELAMKMAGLHSPVWASMPIILLGRRLGAGCWVLRLNFCVIGHCGIGRDWCR